MSEKLPYPETVTGATRRLQELVPIQEGEDPFDWLDRAAQRPEAAALIAQVRQEWADNLWRLDHPGGMPGRGQR